MFHSLANAAVGARITGVDDCTYSSTGESFSAVVLPHSDSHTPKKLQADDVSLAYECGFRLMFNPCLCSVLTQSYRSATSLEKVPWLHLGGAQAKHRSSRRPCTRPFTRPCAHPLHLAPRSQNLAEKGVHEVNARRFVLVSADHPSEFQG